MNRFASHYRNTNVRRIILCLLFIFIGVGTVSAGGTDDLWRKLLEMINGKKKDRAVGFLILEPVPVANGGPADGTAELKVFNQETGDLRRGIMMAVDKVKGDRPWTPTYYSDKNVIIKFYRDLKSADSRDAKIQVLRSFLTTNRSNNPQFNNETIVYGYLNDTMVTVYVYDIGRPAQYYTGEEIFPADADKEARAQEVQNAFESALKAAFGDPPL